MKISILSSMADLASNNIRENLLKLINFKETTKSFDGNQVFNTQTEFNDVDLLLTDKKHITFEEFDKDLDSDLIVVISKHSAVSGKPSLSGHFIGNYSNNEMGGREAKICYSAPLFLKKYFNNLKRNYTESTYDITLESTHHGPFLKTPVVYVEIGSTKNEWIDKEIGKIVAQTLLKTLDLDLNRDYKVAIGFGGTHYCHNFNKVEFVTDICMSHICPKHFVDAMNEDMVKQMINRSTKPAELAIIDWKGLNGEGRNKIINILEKLNFPWKKTKEMI